MPIVRCEICLDRQAVHDLDLRGDHLRQTAQVEGVRAVGCDGLPHGTECWIGKVIRCMQGDGCSVKRGARWIA